MLTGGAGRLAAGTLATLNVRWSCISSFEGVSGNYVADITLLGGLVGVVCTRLVAGWAQPGFLKGLGVAPGMMLTLVVIIRISASPAAEILPTLGGRELASST